MQQNNQTNSPQDDYRIHLIQGRVRELEQLILSATLNGGGTEAVNSYALQQMELRGSYHEAQFILQLLTNPIPTSQE